MNRRITGFVLAVILLLSCVAFGVSAETEMKTSADAVKLLKAEEGFSSKPYWDYAQWTVGYGTKCPDDMLQEYKKNGISEADAEKLLYTYIAKFEAELDKFIARTGVELNQNQYDALLLFSYNCGTGWAYSTSGVFYNAIVSGADGNALINAFSRWCNAGGEIKTYLLRRRLCEANMYLNGVYSQRAPENFGYVIYDAGQGTVSPNVQGYDTELTAQIIPTPTCEGYSFVGWYTDEIGGTKVTKLDADTKNTRLYARWSDSEGNDPAQEAETGVTVTVTTNGVNIRKGPGTNYAAIDKADTGDQLVITETATGGSYTWGKFKDGWICLKYTNYDIVTAPEPETPAEPETWTGTIKVSSTLRVRSGPSTGYDVVGSLKNGTKVEILEQKTAGAMVWGKISTGWISMDYVVLDKASEQEEEPTQPSETEPPETEPPTTQAPADETEEPEQTQIRTGVVKVSDRLRVRSGPSTSDKIVGYLYANEKVTVTEQTTSGSMTWGKTAKGWVSMDYITLDPVESEETTAAKTLTGTVKVKDQLRIRTGPSTSYAIAGYLSDGTKVEITERKTVGSTVWGKVAKGWISLDYVVLDEQETTEQKTVTKTVTADCLRIRSAAGTANKIVGYLYKDAKVEILETKKVGTTTWGRTAKGWISMDYVK